MITFPRFLETMSRRDFANALNNCFDAVTRMQTPRVAPPLQVTGGVINLNGMSFKRYAARLTGVSEVSGQYQYTFIQQEYDATTGVYSDMTVGGLTGDGTTCYATEVNNTQVTETMSPLTPTPAAGTGPFVWLRWKGQVGLAAVFEFNLGLSPELAVYNGDTEIDGAVTRIDSDANSVLTWEDIAAGHVQYVVASATTTQDGVIIVGPQSMTGPKSVVVSESGDWISLNDDYPYGPGGYSPVEIDYPALLASNDNINTCIGFAFDSANGVMILGCFATGALQWPSSLCYAIMTTSGLVKGKTATGAAGDTFVGGLFTGTGTSPILVDLGGTGTTDPSLVAGSNITISGSWPNQTIAASGGSTGVTAVTATAPLTSSGGATPNISFSASSIAGYDANVQQILGHDASGNLAWYDVESGGSGVTGKTIGSEG